MAARIIDRGRGPEIEGTRITVYDVMDYWKGGWHPARIAALFRLSSEQIRAAIDYIEAHREEVTRDYEKILERHRNYEYPPEVKAKIEQNRRKFEAKLAEIRERRKAESEHAGDHVGS